MRFEGYLDIHRKMMSFKRAEIILSFIILIFSIIFTRLYCFYLAFYVFNLRVFINTLWSNFVNKYKTYIDQVHFLLTFWLYSRLILTSKVKVINYNRKKWWWQSLTSHEFQSSLKLPTTSIQNINAKKTPKNNDYNVHAKIIV